MGLKNFLIGLSVLCMAGSAEAGKPEPWQIMFQEPASPVMRMVEEFNITVSIVIIMITILVVILLAIVIVRFNEKANPVPSTTTHNTLIEVLWTAVPVIILVLISVPSFKLLYFVDRHPDPEMTLKITGHQWYWTYEYPDHGGITFDSNIACATAEECEELGKDGEKPLRLLSVDNNVVLPVDTNIRILVASEDVIHNWAIPSFGLKTEATPGRTNESWVMIEKEGIFYGMCSELCGVNHGFMPIAVEAVSKEAFGRWIIESRKKFADAAAPYPRLAARQE